jgi:hypothetical protein
MFNLKKILILSAGIAILLSLVLIKIVPAALDSSEIEELAKETQETSKKIVTLANDLKALIEECSCTNEDVEAQCAGQCCDCVGEACPNRGEIKNKQRGLETHVEELKDLTKELWRGVEILEKTKNGLEPEEKVLELINQVEKMSRLAFLQAIYAQIMAELPDQCGPIVPDSGRNERCVCACYEGIVEFFCQGEACPNERFKRGLNKIEDADREIEETYEEIKNLLSQI